MHGEHKARVQRASTYRVRERDPLCGWCGEPIRSWQENHEERDEAFGNIPVLVHDDCSDTENAG